MIRRGETGKDISIITSFDMSSYTSLYIEAVPPSGRENVKQWTAQLGQALANVTLEDGTVIASVPVNQSMKYTTASVSDLDEVGTWTLVGVYVNANANPPDRFKADPVELNVLDDFYS